MKGEKNGSLVSTILVVPLLSPKSNSFLIGLSVLTTSSVGFDCLFCLLLFYARATVFQLYHGGDMMYEMGRRNHFYTFTDSRDL